MTTTGGRQTMEIRYDVEVDARGLQCPMPIVNARKTFQTLQSGQTLAACHIVIRFGRHRRARRRLQRLGIHRELLRHPEQPLAVNLQLTLHACFHRRNPVGGFATMETVPASRRPDRQLIHSSSVGDVGNPCPVGRHHIDFWITRAGAHEGNRAVARRRLRPVGAKAAAHHG